MSTPRFNVKLLSFIRYVCMCTYIGYYFAKIQVLYKKVMLINSYLKRHLLYHLKPYESVNISSISLVCDKFFPNQFDTCVWMCKYAINFTAFPLNTTCMFAS